jgi:uncharacterized protein with HEPN domain
MSSRRETNALRDIVEESDAISEYLAGKSFDDYRTHRMTVDAVERCLARITEAVVRIGSARMEEVAPGVPMEKVRGLGNLLRHAYDVVDHGTIWDTVKHDLPPLRAACERALAQSSR